MKAPLFLLLVSNTMANAALVARVATDRGTIDVELQHAKAPQAVANFITLAQGTRNRLDPATGAIIDSPLYVGEKFFRVVNDASFKIAQTGSGTGTNSGGPGFTFKDEFDPALTHVPYVLSMANSGPNTNGSQIFFTGNATIPGLNNVHTVFGLVTDVPSRAVIDAIHAAGNNGTTITAITFERTDPAAVAFNEHAQNLPTVTRPAGSLRVSPGNSVVWDFLPAIGTGSIFRVFRSTSLAPSSWSESPLYRIHAGIVRPISNPFIAAAMVDDGSSARAFYNLSVASHPGAVAPSTLANRTVTFPTVGATRTYVFNSLGNGGTLTLTPSSGSPASGTFITFDPVNFVTAKPYSSGGHDINFAAYSPFLSPAEFLIKIGCDSATDTIVTGHFSSQRYFGIWQPYVSGTATITR